VIDRGKHNVLGVLVDAVDYDAAVQKILHAAVAGEPYGATALAVHGVMTGVLDAAHRYRLNHLDLAVPDGQPVRWALNALHHAGLGDRVYGPELTLRLCDGAARQGLPVYFYGSERAVLDALVRNLQARFPHLVVAGSHPSRFRVTTDEEKREIVARIRGSGARLVFVGLGCPRQETWVYEYRRELGLPAIAVGAAFDFHAGTLPQAPRRLQDLGLEWLFRLIKEPRRLWKRYLYLNPYYAWLLMLQRSGAWKPDPRSARPPERNCNYG
jgi:exopolysaccharide biosynthesis WecB/TagA/CpsF family protein